LILSGDFIRKAVESGDITIVPFNSRQVGPNSYDFRLGTRCRTYRDHLLDAKLMNETQEFEMPENGMILEPQKLYLFNTAEVLGSCKYVPIIKGRSSVGRLGLFINITADLIDVGSINQWTLQLHSIIPVRVFPGMLIGQVTFWTIDGHIIPYSGKYAGLQSPVASLSYLDFGATIGGDLP
jgi:dCTP deaminase